MSEWFMPLEPTALEPQELELIRTALSEMQQRCARDQHNMELGPARREQAGALLVRIDFLLARLEVL